MSGGEEERVGARQVLLHYKWQKQKIVTSLHSGRIGGSRKLCHEGCQ